MTVELNNNYLCQFCYSNIEAPYSLPCGDQICQKHLINESYIICPQCKKEHNIFSSNFNHPHTSNVFKNHCVQDKRDLIQRRRDLIQELESLITDPHFYLYECILDVKNEIDIQHEHEVISMKNYQDLIEELNKFELKQKKNFKVADTYKSILRISKESEFNIGQDDLNLDIKRLEDAVSDLKDSIKNYHNLNFIETVDLDLSNNVSGSQIGNEQKTMKIIRIFFENKKLKKEVCKRIQDQKRLHMRENLDQQNPRHFSKFITADHELNKRLWTI